MTEMRHVLVIAVSIAFAVIWTGLIVATASPVSSFILDHQIPAAVPIVLGLEVLIFLTAAGLYVRSHWSSSWPLGGFLRIPGRRGWTIALVGGLIVWACALPFPPDVIESVPSGIVGGADGPDVIYVRLIPKQPDHIIYSAAVGVASFAVLFVAARMDRKKKGEGATDNPGGPQ